MSTLKTLRTLRTLTGITSIDVTSVYGEPVVLHTTVGSYYEWNIVLAVPITIESSIVVDWLDTEIVCTYNAEDEAFVMRDVLYPLYKNKTASELAGILR